MPLLRTCDGCGYKLPLFQPRKRAEDGRLLCDGCHPDGRGEPGRPVGVHGSRTAARADVNYIVQDTGSGFQILDGPFDLSTYPNPEVEQAMDAALARHPGAKIMGGEWVDSLVGVVDLREASRRRVKHAVDRTPQRHASGHPGVSHRHAQAGGQSSDVGPVGFAHGRGVARDPDRLRRLAHDSGDGATIYHCPFCGAGQVTARSDGTVECGYCKQFFTVQVQPERSSMPQTINGQPIEVPGMPGSVDSAPPGQEPGQEPAQEGAGDAGAFTPPDAPADVFTPPEEPAAPQQVAASRFYLTAEGVALDEDAYLRHLAIHHADDKAAVIADVRAERGL